VPSSCPRCGAAVADGDRFCRSCGAELPAPADVTGVIPVPAGDSGPLPIVDETTVGGLAPGAAVLLVRRGPNEGARFVLDAEELGAGRSPDSDIFLDDVTVSRRHARFRHEQGRWVVDDAGSLNGTYVNKSRIDGPRVLVGGDEVQIGKYRFTFLAAAEPPVG
jgi:hypothetical protein